MMPAAKTKAKLRTPVRYGKFNDKGEQRVVNFKEGQEVSKSDFDDDTWQQFLDDGGILDFGDDPDVEDPDNPTNPGQPSISELAGAPQATGTQEDAGGK